MKKSIFIIMSVAVLLNAMGCTKDETKAAISDNLVEAISEEEVKEEESKEVKVVNKEFTNFDIGDWEGDNYVNRYINMSFPKIKDWDILSDDELSKYGELSAEEITGIREGEILPEDVSVFYCFALSKDEGLGNIIFGFENFSTDISLQAGDSLVEKKYIEKLSSKLQESEEIEYDIEGITKVTIADKEFYELTITTLSGKLVQKYYVHKIDSMMCFMMVTAYDGYEEDIKTFIEEIKVASNDID